MPRASWPCDADQFVFPALRSAVDSRDGVGVSSGAEGSSAGGSASGSGGVAPAGSMSGTTSSVNVQLARRVILFFVIPEEKQGGCAVCVKSRRNT